MASGAVVTSGSSESSIAPSSLDQLQISSTPIASVEYENFLVHIYPKSNQLKSADLNCYQQYYHSPLALLDVESIQTNYNKNEDKHEVKFSIKMWDEEIKNKVVKRLKEVLHLPSSIIESPSSQPKVPKTLEVQVIPYKEVLLTYAKKSKLFSLDSEWEPCGQLPMSMTFKLVSTSKEKAKELAKYMREEPEEFLGFRLYFRLSSMVTRKSQTHIDLDIMSKSGIASKLQQRFPHKSSVLMADDETNRLLKEFTDVSFETYTEIEEAESKNGFNPYEMMEKMLIDSRETIKKGDDAAWESVFWMDENSRPDVVCREVNDISSHLSSEEMDVIVDEFKKERGGESQVTLDTQNKELTDKQLESNTMKENEMKRAKSQSAMTKNQADEKSTDASKSNMKGDADVKFWKLKVGKLSADYNSEDNHSLENRTTSEEDNKNKEVDASKHRRESFNKSAVKEDVADSYKTGVSNAVKMLDSGSRKREKMRKILAENKSHIEWDGKKFTPKSLDLNRVNVGNIRSKKVFRELRTIASFIAASICLRINVPNNKDASDGKLVSQLSEAIENQTMRNQHQDNFCCQVWTTIAAFTGRMLEEESRELMWRWAPLVIILIIVVILARLYLSDEISIEF